MGEQFNPKGAVKNIGKNSPQLYLQVKDRVRWFREEHPKGRITADVLVLDIERGYAAVKATVTNEAGGTADNYGSAWRELLLDRAKQQRRPDAEMIAGDFLEWATTSAIGRALAGLGYGTEDALDFDMSAPADAPHNTDQEPRHAEKAQDARNGVQATQHTPTPARAASAPAGAVSESTEPARATTEQQTQIRNFVGNAGMTMDELLDQLDITSLSELTAEKAGKVIDRLSKRAAERFSRAAQAAPDPNSPVADTPRLTAVR